MPIDHQAPPLRDPSPGSLGRTSEGRGLQAVGGVGGEDDPGWRAFLSSVHRRWALLVSFAVLLEVAARLGRPVGPADVRWTALIILLAANFSLHSVARTGAFRWWMLPVTHGVDVLAAGVFTSLYGPGWAAIFFVLVIQPYASSRSFLPAFACAAPAALVYLGAGLAHYSLVLQGGAADVLGPLTLEAVALLGVLLIVYRRGGIKVARLLATREVLRAAHGGDLHARTTPGRPDEVGLVESAVNETLDGLAGTMVQVGEQVREVAAFATMLSQTSSGVLETSRTVAATATTLANVLASQQRRVEESRSRSTESEVTANRVRDQATGIVDEATGLQGKVQLGRERVQRASDTLLAISDEVRTAAETVGELSQMSERINVFAHTISRISRQTHVLALNAAIEAAHTDSAREGFSAVAEEVRELAAQSAAAAREVSELIEEIQTRIDAVSRVMGSGAERVRDVGGISREAIAALIELDRGVSDISAVLTASADLAQTQAKHMTDLAHQMTDVAATNARSAADAQGAADVMRNQEAALQDLQQVSREMETLADGLRAGVERFVTEPPSLPPDSA